ncbi:MAG: hypothetical protein OXF01_13205, partial [Gemmatimonadetes bacterium]|nr:hypothetical protein [Gemmatimonadota bacterium]
MTDHRENRAGHKASEMWVGLRTICGDTSVVVGIVVEGRAHVFLAPRDVIGKLADQITVVLDEPLPRRSPPQPHLLSR